MHIINRVNDRRRFQRLKANINVWYKILNPVETVNLIGDKEIEASTLDISAGGMSLSSRYNLPAHATLLLKFILLKTDNKGFVDISKPTEVLGRVRYSVLSENSEYRVGISFTGLKGEQRCDITGFVKP